MLHAMAAASAKLRNFILFVCFVSRYCCLVGIGRVLLRVQELEVVVVCFYFSSKKEEETFESVTLNIGKTYWYDKISFHILFTHI